MSAIWDDPTVDRALLLVQVRRPSGMLDLADVTFRDNTPLPPPPGGALGAVLWALGSARVGLSIGVLRRLTVLVLWVL